MDTTTQKAVAGRPMTTPGAPRCALYTRCSTDEQATKFGLPSQLRACRTVAEQRGYTIVAVFTDEGISGSTMDRPQLTALRDAVRSGSLDVVVTHDIDRLSRSLVDQLVLDAEFTKARCRLEFATYERRHDAEGLMFDHIKGVLAQYERVKITERTLRGRKEKARKGLVPGGCTPYGYRLDPTAVGGYVVHPEEAEVVTRAFGWVLDGLSIRQVAQRLHAQGSRPRRGTRWNPSTLRRLLRCATYAGTAHFGAGSPDAISIPVPPIVSPTTFARVQQQLTRNGTVLVGAPSAQSYLLKGLLRCGGCGHRMSGTVYTSRQGTKVRYYRCAGRDPMTGPGTCRVPLQRADVLEPATWDVVVGLLRDPSQLLTEARTKRLALDADRSDANTEVAQAKKALAKLQRQRALLLDALLSEAIDKLTFITRDAPLKVQEDALATQLSQATGRLSQSSVDVGRHESVVRYCKLIRSGLDRLDDDGRQALLRRLVDHVVVHERGLEVHVTIAVSESPQKLANRSECRGIRRA